MNPKEKATEFINKFFQPLDKAIDADIVGKRKALAKKHALICVDEILKDHPYISSFRLKYWQEVKQEIEKL